MNKVYTIFSEILKLCPRYHFDKAVEQYQGDRYVKTFTTWQQFMAILYSQITQKDSLRDIRWYHLGLTGIYKSTLSDANAKIVSIDKAYIDYKWLNSLDEQGVWFVTRAKTNIDYAVVGQHPISNQKVLSDERISLQGPLTKSKYSKELRLIRYCDEERQKTLTFLTNNFKLAATTIAQIYKSRWQIELFFKWIKQNLKIKSFLGTSKNAVLTQNLGGDVLLPSADVYQVSDEIRLLAATIEPGNPGNAV